MHFRKQIHRLSLYSAVMVLACLLSGMLGCTIHVRNSPSTRPVSQNPPHYTMNKPAPPPASPRAYERASEKAPPFNPNMTPGQHGQEMKARNAPAHAQGKGPQPAPGQQQVPPGQLKKLEAAQAQNSPAQGKGPQHAPGQQQVPPGQLKKLEAAQGQHRGKGHQTTQDAHQVQGNNPQVAKLELPNSGHGAAQSHRPDTASAGPAHNPDGRGNHGHQAAPMNAPESEPMQTAALIPEEPPVLPMPERGGRTFHQAERNFITSYFKAGPGKNFFEKLEPTVINQNPEPEPPKSSQKGGSKGGKKNARKGSGKKSGKGPAKNQPEETAQPAPQRRIPQSLLADQVQVTDEIPFDKQLQELPPDLNAQLPVPMPNTRRVILKRQVLLLETSSQKVLDLINL